MKIFTVLLFAVLFTIPVFAELEQTFILEGDFVLLTDVADRLKSEYADWRPGFSIACGYMLSPSRFISAGGRLSYIRMRSAEQRKVSINALGMLASIRPQYRFTNPLKPTPFIQISPGVYRIVSKDIDDSELLGHSFFALESGAGLSIGSIEFGAIYNLALRGENMRLGWVSIFAGLRMGT
jgi:hypothetical protein